MKYWSLAVLALAGCALQGGASLSRLGSVDALHAPRFWSGHVSAHARIGRFVAGAEVEGVGAGKNKRWSGFTSGLQAGVAPMGESAPIEVLVLLEAGVPIAWDTTRGLYYGSTLELPIALDGALPTTERNRNLTILGSRAQIAPFLRARWYVDGGGERGFAMPPLVVSLGVALRVKYSTDLIDLGTR